MRTDTEGGGGGDGSRGDGDPASIREHTSWMRELADATDGLSQAIGEALCVVGDGWQDPVGDAFCARMGERSQAATMFAEDVRQVADEFDIAAVTLERAQAKVDAARAYIATADPFLLAIEDGKVLPPSVPAGSVPGPLAVELFSEAFDGGQLEQALAQYEYIREQILSAQDDVRPAVGALQAVADMFTPRWYLHLSGLALNRIEWYGSQFRLRFIEQSWPLEHTRNTSKYFAELCRIKNAPDIAEIYEVQYRRVGAVLDTKLAWASRLQSMSRIANSGGYALTVVGILLDVAGGDTYDTAVVKASPGMAITIAAIILGFPAGWVAAAGIVGGTLVGDDLGTWYKRNVEHAPVPIDNSWCKDL